MKRAPINKPRHWFIKISPAERKSYDEIVDLFARVRVMRRSLNVRPSDETQERVRDLLERNAADELREGNGT